MAEYKAFTSGVEVNGQTIYSVIDAMKGFDDIAHELLDKNGIKNFSRDDWYPQEAWLNAFKDIAENVGEKTLFNIGKAILTNAMLPPGIDTIDKGLSLIDVAYHMNHRLDGKIMFDPSNGVMLEGIGHYLYEKTGEKSAKMIGQNPYPCEFDRGIVMSMARRFQPLAEVVLDKSVKNRKDGNETSTYLVTW